MKLSSRNGRVGSAMRLAAAAIFATGLATGLAAGAAHAEIAHYNPGVLNIRDLVMPAEPGTYGALYNYYYKADRVNDRDGDKIRSVNVGSGHGPGLDIAVDVDIDMYALMSVVMWVSDWKILGARYGAFIAPSFANVGINAQLGNESVLGRSASNSSFGVADMFVQPLWLGWDVPHFGASLGYGFYAPTGQYNTRPVDLPDGTTVRVESPDNIGYGYWTHQFQTAAAWYPWADKRMSVNLAGTYEINENKQDFDLTAGDVITINWGVSQYLPLKKDNTLLVEAGVGGYDQFQVSEDSGPDVRGDAEDNVHAAGFQVGLASVPWGAALNFHYDYEFTADDRFQGHVIGLSIAKKLTGI